MISFLVLFIKEVDNYIEIRLYRDVIVVTNTATWKTNKV